MNARTRARLAVGSVVLMLLLGQYDVVQLGLQPWPLVAAAQALMWCSSCLGASRPAGRCWFPSYPSYLASSRRGRTPKRVQRGRG